MCKIERSTTVKLRLLFLLLAVVLCVFRGGKKKNKIVAISLFASVFLVLSILIYRE